MKAPFTCFATAVLVLFAASSQAATYQQKYKLLALGTPSITFNGNSSNGNALNSQGQVVGRTHEINIPATYATLWNGATPSNIGSLGVTNGNVSTALGINDAGIVVGQSQYRAIVWNGATATELIGIPGQFTSSADAVNRAGQIAGASRNGHATLWTGTDIIDLGTLGGSQSGASALNNMGQVVGWSTPDGDPIYHSGISGGAGFPITRATLWNGNSATDLGTLGGFGSYAFGINDAGQVVGMSVIGDATTTGNPVFHAALWSSAGIVDLDIPGDMTSSSRALGINNAGQIVGNINGRATIWNGTNATDLNSLLDDNSGLSWSLHSAQAINDRGQITGTGYNFATGQSEAFLLTPVPEPQTYALMLAGLGFMGFVARRRSRQQ